MSISRYQPPALKDLINSLHKVIEEYKGDRTEEPQLIKKVLSLIEIDLALAENEDPASKIIRENNALEFLLGLSFFVHQFINNSYGLPGVSLVPTIVRTGFSLFSSWSPVSSPYNSNRSGLFQLINKALLLDEESNKNKEIKNTLDSTDPENGNDPTKFICLASFRTYLDNYPSLVNERVRTHINAITKEAKGSLDQNIKNLCDRLAAEKLMHESAAHLAEEYKKVCAEDYFPPDSPFNFIWGRTNERMECLEFINVLEQHLIETKVPEKDREFILKGACIKFMAAIENEIKYRYFLSPERSTTYKLLQQKTGFTRSSQFIDYTQLYLAALHKTLCETVVSEDQLAFWKNHGIEKTSLDKAKHDITTLQSELSQAKTGIYTGNRTADVIVNQLFNSISASIVQTGVLCVSVGVTAKSSISFSTFLATASAYPQLALATMGILWAVNHLRAPISSAITNAITPMVKPVLLLPLNAALFCTTKQTLFQPGQKMSSEMIVENEKLIKALLFSSDDICPVAEKEKIRALMGMNTLEVAVGPSVNDTSDTEDTRQGRLYGMR